MAGAVAALRLLAQAFGNFKGLQANGFKGWDFTTSPCQKWSGVTCNANGRVTKLCASHHTYSIHSSVNLLSSAFVYASIMQASH